MDGGPLDYESPAGPMIREIWQLVANAPVEVQDYMITTDHFRGIYRRIYPNLIKGNRRKSTCYRLDLQTLESQPNMPKNLPNHCAGHRMHCYEHARGKERRVPTMACSTYEEPWKVHQPWQ